MLIKYIQTRSGGIRITGIEGVLSWSELSEKYGESVRNSYIERLPNMTFCENNLYLYSIKDNGTVKDKKLVIGEEYDPRYFVKCKSLAMLCEERLKEIINYVEEEEIFDSSIYLRK